MRLTEKSLQQLKPQKSIYILSDRDGLSIHVTPKGSKSWYLRYRWQGQQRKMTLGWYPILSLKDARNKCSEMRTLLYYGIDPKTKRKGRHLGISADQLTFEAFIPRWKRIKHQKLGFADPLRRNSTQTQIERYLNKDILPALGHLPLDQITRQDISGLLSCMEARGAFVPAEKCRSWLDEIFRHAVVEGYIDTNPATDMDVVALPKPPVSNNPYLTMDELPNLLMALRDYPGALQIKLALKLLLLTGVRPGELRFAKPEHFDVDHALWRVPAKEVKQLKKKVHKGEKIPDYLVPLSTQAAEIAKELLSMCYQNQKYLLLGRSDPNKPISENTLNQGLQRLGYKGKLTTHGIRGTISTALYEMNYKDKWIEAQLSHVDPNKTRRSYNHAQYLEQRRKMMQDWADKLDLWEKQGKQEV